MRKMRYDSIYSDLPRCEEDSDYPWLDCPEIMSEDEDPSAVSPEPPRPPESKYPLYIQLAIKRLEYGTDEERLGVLHRYPQVRTFCAFVSSGKPTRRRGRYK